MVGMNIYDIPIRQADGTETTLAPYRGRVLLIVNVASKCGFTPQYKGLEALYQKYKEAGLTILGFPCNQFLFQEPGDDRAIQNFCSLNYGVTFPVFSKIDVNGSNAHPLYQFLRSEKSGTLWTSRIKWNFTKFLIGRTGEVVSRHGPFTTPEQLSTTIEEQLKR
jgi:glutathione peroxidase